MTVLCLFYVDFVCLFTCFVSAVCEMIFFFCSVCDDCFSFFYVSVPFSLLIDFLGRYLNLFFTFYNFHTLCLVSFLSSLFIFHFGRCFVSVLCLSSSTLF